MIGTKEGITTATGAEATTTTSAQLHAARSPWSTASSLRRTATFSVLLEKFPCCEIDASTAVFKALNFLDKLSASLTILSRRTTKRFERAFTSPT